MSSAIALLVPLLLAAPQAEAFVAGAGPGKTPVDVAVQARVGEQVTLYAVVALGRGAHRRYHTAAPALVVRGRRIPASRLRPLGELPRVRFAWWQVEPEQQHVSLPPPNPGQQSYANAVMGGPRHGRWIGFDTIEYAERPLAGETGPSLTLTRATPLDPKLQGRGGPGTLRFRFEASWEGGRAASPGRESTVTGGISERVLRVSFRGSDDLLGWLGSYFNVPYVFGSVDVGVRNQTEGYQGTDCADVIVGAARRAGARMGYTNVAGLFRLARAVTGRLRLERSGITWATGPRAGEAATLRFGTDVQPGDLMVMDFLGAGGLPRGWVHVAVIARDAGTKGLFDPKDRVLHMGLTRGLEEIPAGDLGPAEVQILRWHPRHTNPYRSQTK